MSNRTADPNHAPSSLHDLVCAAAHRDPDAVAILAPGRTALTYRGLLAHIDGVAAWLGAAGVTRDDRVAIVLPNGPEMATAFLGVAAVASSAPLNPAYRDEDFEFYFADLAAKVLIVERGADSPAVAVARRRGMRVVELCTVSKAPAGVFMLDGVLPEGDGRVALGGPEDTCLVLHTSGTTSRPKIVPLSHGNLSASADNVRRTLDLTAADRCLNVMPLFHIHGLVASLLASLCAGGSVVCTRGLDAAQFFGWLDIHEPTWYTAVPTMHQAILDQADVHAELIARRPLRFIRSSSSSLPPQVMAALERVFRAPVIEAYGMTEAAHQMASNPLPPRVRKPGFVGMAAGPEVAIMGEDGNLLPPGSIGEVVIRGRNVTHGYEGNAAANAAAFTHGWFRTGDQGVMDQEGYLALTGRLKEIINRGGEKIAPREIDEALLDHPGIRQALAFGVRHPTLGEDVAAAVVARDGQSLDETEVRTFLRGRLPDFKVPSRIVVLAEIPKGATGKLQRIGLADKLAHVLTASFEAPSGEMEALVAATFAQLLPSARIGRHDNFFAVGGDSIRAMQVVSRLNASLGLKLPPTTVFRWPTVAALATHLCQRRNEDTASLAAEVEQLPPGEVDRLLHDLPERDA